MKKVLYILFFSLLLNPLFAQVLDYNYLFKSANDMFNKGNYSGAKVRFIIAQRRALKENNYPASEQCKDYQDKADECAQDLKNGERTFGMGDFAIAKRYYDRLAELNPKDPNNTLRAAKCREETDYLNTKRQADDFYTNKDWNQAYSLYMVCLDSSKKELSSYKRYYLEVDRKNQECLRQMNILNPDSIKLKLKATKDKLIKKFGKKKEDNKPEEQKPEEKKPEEKPKNEALLYLRRGENLLFFNFTNSSMITTKKNKNIA